ncbi:Rv3235 family protein [Streptomyces sp. NPDC003036]|uniref:Rv3235 family protein n=1 Tax=Streptomyces sp. NPDC003036 TaxID=3154442 RepID=UPI0033A36E7A
MTTAATRTQTSRTTTRPQTPRPAGRRDQRAPGGAGTVRQARPQRPQPPHAVFAERLLAVLSGERPVHWMLGQTVGEAYDQLIRLAPHAPLRARGAHAARPVIRRCGVFPLRPGVVEAFATIATGDRFRAMAFRLEQGEDRRWRCAAVELGGNHP